MCRRNGCTAAGCGTITGFGAMIVAPISTWRGEQVSGIRKVGLGSDLAVPLTSGGGLLSGVKLKKAYQKLTLGSKVGLLQEAAILRGGIEQPDVAHEQKSTHLVEQRLRVPEVGGIEAFGEPAVDGGEQVMGLGASALVAPQAGETGSGAQLPQLCALFLCHR
jgi:hypothetical protein